MVLLDDGYQNSKINKDLSLVVVDSEILFGNEFIFPLGPLRENINSGLSRANAIVLVGNSCKINTSKIKKLMSDKEVEYVDLRFTDPRGKLQHLTMDSSVVDEEMLEKGVFFDGSSIAGW